MTLQPRTEPPVEPAGRASGQDAPVPSAAKAAHEKTRADAFLAAIVESSDDAIVTKDLNGIITGWNGAAERIFGYGAEEAIGKPVLMIIPADRAGEEARILASIRRGERVEHYETVRVRKDGTRVDVSVTVSPVKDGNGRIIGASKIARDISGRKQAEEALRDAEARFRTAIRQIADYAIFSTDPAGVIITWNEGCQHVLGYAEEEFVGLNAERLFVPEDVAAGMPENELKTAVERGRANNDRWMLRKNGDRFWASGITTALYDAAGKLIGFSKVMRDMTEQQQTQQAIQQSMKRLRFFSDAARSLLETGDPVELLNDAYNALMDTFGLDFYFHFTVEPHGERLRLRTARGIPAELAGRIENQEFGEAICGRVARDLKPLIIADVQQSHEPITEFIRGLGITAYVCHPLVANGELLGTLSFGTRQERAFTPELIRLLRALTDMVATAIARKRAEETLQERARLLDLSKDAIIVRDLDDRVLYWNRGAEILYGWTEKEALGKVPYRLLKSIFPEPLEQILEKLHRQGFWEGEVEQTTREGRQVTVLARWAIDRDREGHPVRILQTHTDITRRKQTEATLERNAAQFRLVVESAPNGMVMVNEAGTILMVNSQIERLFGYERAEMIGQPIEMLLPERYRGRHPGQRQEFFHSPTTRAMGHGRDLFARRKDGSEFPVEVGLNPAETPDGTMVLAAVIDITQRKSMEAELAKAHEDLADYARNLELAVVERTAHLQQTIAELEGVSYSLSHDMRAPLRTIRSFSEIVLAQAGEKLGANETELLQTSISAAGRLDRLIQDVLIYSRVSREAIELATIDVEQLMRQIIHERPEFQSPRAEIALQAPLEPVRGHEAYLTQCITNLLDNAVKFVPAARKPQVRVWSESVDNEVRLWFEDNGIGIAPEAQERVFGIFQRVHAENTYPGTGIGLAIVRKAVERMGGRVGLESEPDRGSRFWIQLHRGE